MTRVEQEWTVVACGLIAHADQCWEVGEWDRMLAILEDDVDEDREAEWSALAADQSALEARFRDLDPPPATFAPELLRRCWRMALADGDGSDLEAAVHERIAQRLGVGFEQAQAIRDEVGALANQRAVLVLHLAALLANLDGRLDVAEAAAFDTLLEHAPLPVSKRLDLAALLHAPPQLEDVVAGLVQLPLDERTETLRQLVPMILASARGDRERIAFLELADRITVGRDRAVELLGE